MNALPTDASPPHPLRILYAEDVRELRDLARLVFSRDGHHIQCAADGVEALEVLTEHLDEFELLITDHHMPRMNGLELVSNVRRLGFKGKIMVFSSELNPAVSASYYKLEVDKVLSKPVYPSFLRRTISEMFAPLSVP